MQLTRSYAQQLRFAASHPSYETQVKRQQYWIKRLAEQQQLADEILADELASLDHQDITQETQFATANIHSATLDNPDANEGPIEVGMDVTIAGLDPSTGAIPPPPPGR